MTAVDAAVVLMRAFLAALETDPQTPADGYVTLRGCAELRDVVAEIERLASRSLPSEGWVKDGHHQILVTDTGTIERAWSSPAPTWDWDAALSSWVRWASDTYGIPERSLAEIAGDLASTIGPGKSKAWKVTELKKRGIPTDMIRRTEGAGRWRYTARRDPP